MTTDALNAGQIKTVPIKWIWVLACSLGILLLFIYQSDARNQGTINQRIEDNQKLQASAIGSLQVEVKDMRIQNAKDSSEILRQLEGINTSIEFLKRQ